MGQRLALAEAALTKAWELEPTLPWAATAMLTVELGQGRGLERMQTWFQRALDAFPDHYQACQAKLKYLDPKWHGSEKEMMAFARACRASENWEGLFPLIMVEAHENLAAHRKDSQAYLASPPVWNEIRAAFEAYLKRNPNSVYERSRYAMRASWCQQWAEALRQCEILGDTPDLGVFKSLDGYRWFVADVRKKARGTTAP